MALHHREGHTLKAIQHDIQSLRHVAIERYLRTRDRIDRQHRLRALLSLLLILSAIALTWILVLATHRHI